MKRYILLILLCVNASLGWSQTNSEQAVPVDSVPVRMPIAEYTFKPKQLILPAALIGVGAAGHLIDGMEDYHLFKRGTRDKQIRVDDYLEWGMLGWVFVCDLMGKEKHNWVDQLMVVGLAEVLNAGMVQGLKEVVDVKRPDGKSHSFPSGHTSNAFLGAHIAYKEFRHSSPVLAYSGYAIATFVAASRIYNNRHWMADVVAGAGFGILSAELSYLIYFPVRNAIARNINKKAADNWVIAPTMQSNNVGLYLSFRF
ncbi:membrane-associated phospholipid phosphatase [Parabacteroides sp. PFB2-12]|uniref:phosphatase PAP2 family protein n=1 Tax=unclassified Parabacteroides TaxID=2649774 RepID=UPI0024757A31|nr:MULTISPECIES: phosphatase PAP2 family protein [unclassified Parabacteroides]MDH6343884.1 membrane-associated phospholipid phosphatase [Parabacteroides sp. PM6-13]MDH6391246.1 membrane-associated phospholipid phosphatase [Parabacteroides sp. PFB2-12]